MERTQTLVNFKMSIKVKEMDGGRLWRRKRRKRRKRRRKWREKDTEVFRCVIPAFLITSLIITEKEDEDGGGEGRRGEEAKRRKEKISIHHLQLSYSLLPSYLTRKQGRGETRGRGGEEETKRKEMKKEREGRRENKEMSSAVLSLHSSLPGYKKEEKEEEEEEER